MTAAAKVFNRLLLGAYALATITLAQGQNGLQAPPPIAFGPWTEVGRREAGTEYEVRFPSARPSGIPVNDGVVLRAFLPARGAAPFPCVLLLHYWGATDLRLERDVAEELNLRGIAAVAVVLPYHLMRTPPGARSGELAIQPDVGALVATMRQCIADVRRTADWVGSRPEFSPQPLGIAGTSLGAIVGALAFGVEPRFGFFSSMLGGVDLAGILWTSSRVTSARDSLRRKGWTETRLREALEPIEPLTYLRPLDERPGSRAYTIAARFDHVIRPEFAAKLSERLGTAANLWLDTGHYGGALVERSVHRSIATFYHRAFVGEPFRAPTGLYAPTIRVGVFASDDGGVQVGAGLDVWRADARGKGFATALLTPRGARAFVGVEVTRGLSVGISASTRRTTWGAFWNIVL